CCKTSEGASVARCPSEPRVVRLSSYGKCFVVIVSIYSFDPITVVSYRAKITSLLRASSLFRPHHKSSRRGVPHLLLWWRRRVPPPGPLRLFHATFIAIVGFPTD